MLSQLDYQSAASLPYEQPAELLFEWLHPFFGNTVARYCCLSLGRNIPMCSAVFVVLALLH